MKPVYTYIGHGSHKFKTSKGTVIYVDPFFHGDYSEPAQILLVTHNHHDHNQVDKVSVSELGLVVMPEMAYDGEYHEFSHEDVKVKAVAAYNQNHKKEECVGYVLEFDGLKFYVAGDTSKTTEMETVLAPMELDYAVLPIDGVYNMGPEEASECAKIMKVKHVFPSHNDPASTKTWEYSELGLDKFIHPGKIVLKHGESFEL